MGSPHLPWLDRRGRMPTNEKLKTVSKNWDGSTWENYLGWQDGISCESMISPQKYERLKESMEHSIFEPSLNATEDLPSNKLDLTMLLHRLTTRQRQIIKLVFWESLSDREIAKQLSISRGTVQDLRERSLQKLKNWGQGRQLQFDNCQF